mmetsp:Transcript_90771/g.256320  ORF Transcript_90771/g.256320 Transcript_90771/m.256320 type:complete len:224 (-) Transcript_90771:62-733(-)|eukprot:CAMPEP_0117500538 /NCGR_PEP_ID=MMETSP0784-20121206/22827_1 /TAXON_ID=39447 /ORGANISM="" /LENGTH=223 /DNA_ID=CAMNT_0005295749 /DNA_START=134 /DNA_END=805 /DNA_ORIENTATION=-
MGVHGSVRQSPLLSYLESEFSRVAKSKLTLHLHQVQMLKPPEDFPLDMRHIPTLWKLDADHSGDVSCTELVDFAEFCNERWQMLGSLDFQSKLKAQCDVDLWDVICEEKGREAFADWVVRLVSQGEEHKTNDFSPNVQFMSGEAIMTLYRLMTPYHIDSHIDQQGFLDMLQQIGEHRDLMPLENESFDDLVPVEVVHNWVNRYITAYASLFEKLNLAPPSVQE